MVDEAAAILKARGLRVVAYTGGLGRPENATREQAVLRWPGSLNAAQLVKLLDDGERAVRGDASAGLGALARADRLNAEGKKKE